jgi:uncharacterized protein YjbI with pentapeptide repeats
VHGFDCQFPDAPAEFKFEGLDWCRFHLPLKDSMGNQSDKWLGINGWELEDGVEWDAFKLRLVAQLSVASQVTGRGNSREANCKFVAFPHGFYFRELIQPLNVNFTGASFGYRAFFDAQRFGTVADFTQANFWGGASFTSATFEREANFYGAKFWDIADFKCSKFRGRAEFSDAKFANLAHFDGATFNSAANFINATLEGKADFNQATFCGVTHFDDAKLGDRSSFTDAKFLGEATFSVRDVDKANPNFQRINFSKARFFGPCSFENRKFTANASFNDAEFHDLVKFHGCTFHQGMSFHKTDFHKTHGGYDAEGFEIDSETEKLERAYRTLKLGMETLRARNEEAMFFAKEMECRRNRSDIGLFEHFVAFVYKKLSNYGQSILRPFLCLLGFTVFMAAVYYLIGRATLSDVALDIFYGLPFPMDIATITLEQIFRPFAIWAPQVDCDIEGGVDAVHISRVTRFELMCNNSYLIAILASVQSLATLSLLALFLLALRRRFKMD